MVQEFKNLLGPEEIQQLLDYHYVDDDRTDARPDVRSKHPRWDQDVWPQHVIKRCLDAVLDEPYVVEEVVCNEQKTTALRIHADSSDGNQNELYKAVLIPLAFEGSSHTVFFNNYWFEKTSKFSRDDISPFRYNLVGKHQIIHEVADIRELLKLCYSDPTSVIDFEVDRNFIAMLSDLIEKRSGNGLGPVDNRTSDYTNVLNFLPGVAFDSTIRNNYLKHLSEQTLEGLSLDRVVPWAIGNVIVFDRQQLHCASHCHSQKIGLTIFTRRKL